MNFETSESHEKIWNCIDKEKMVDLAKDLVNIPSATGEEEECSLFINDYLQGIGLEPFLQEVEPNRSNCIATLKGKGKGATLLFNGHMDTSYSGKEEFLPKVRAFQPEAYEEDGWIYGLGIYNMKGALACYIAAMEAVKASGVELGGDVKFAAVVGEIERGPVDKYQGSSFRGGGFGTSYYVTHGGIADVAVIGEPTGLSLLPGHLGYMWSKITLVGSPSHTSYSHNYPNTISQMTKIIAALEKWGEDYRERRKYKGYPANLNLSAIEGGWPYRCSRTPVFCTLYIDTRVPPDISMMEVRSEIEDVLAKVTKDDSSIDPRLETIMTVPGTEIDIESSVSQVVMKSHENVFKEKPEIISEAYISDATYLNRFGIPTVNYGPAGRLRTTSDSRWDPNAGEHVSIQDLCDCTRVYVSLILNVCSKRREEFLA